MHHYSRPVIGGASPIEATILFGSDKGLSIPTLDRAGRLHIMMSIKQYRLGLGIYNLAGDNCRHSFFPSGRRRSFYFRFHAQI